MPYTLPSHKDMLKAGVHFGQKASRWYPKMAPYIYGVKNDVHIIDLEKTAELLKKAADAARDIASKGGMILFVGTKKPAREIVKKHALECGMPYVTRRWLGGTLTNFSTISKVIRKYKTMRDKMATGGYKKYTKKEQLDISREIERLEKLVGGISLLDKPPEALFVVDTHKEKTVMAEAAKQHIPVIGICDTNANPDKVKYVIPANDDATKSIDLICKTMADAIIEGKAMGRAQAQDRQVAPGPAGGSPAPRTAS